MAHQKEFFLEYAKKNGFELFRVYADEGINLVLNADEAKTKFGCEWNPRGVRRVLTEVDHHRSDVQDKVSVEDVKKKRKRLLAKKSRYQEMYANDVMTMTELKEKTAQISEELAELDFSLKQLNRSVAVQQDSENLVKLYIREIEQFLALETVTNLDLRRIVDKISVNRDGTVQIVLKS